MRNWTWSVLILHINFKWFAYGELKALCKTWLWCQVVGHPKTHDMTAACWQGKVHIGWKSRNFKLCLLDPFGWVYLCIHRRQKKCIDILPEVLSPINSKIIVIKISEGSVKYNFSYHTETILFTDGQQHHNIRPGSARKKSFGQMLHIFFLSNKRYTSQLGWHKK